MNQKEGTYSHCSVCKIKKNCCCDFDEGIDDIVVTIKEKNEIIKRLGKGAEKLFKKINDEVYNVLSQNSICPFYNNGCLIYDIRPNDCKLFPYDLKKIEENYYLIKYELPCGSKNVNEDVDGIVKELFEIINIYTDKKVGEKVGRLPYKIIKEVKP